MQHIPGFDYSKHLTNYCAKLVNMGLKLAGLPPLPSNVATDAARYGVAVDPAHAQRGDVAVMMDGHRIGELGGHVGSLTGRTRMRNGSEEFEVYSSNSLDASGHVIGVPGYRWRRPDYIRRAPNIMPANANPTKPSPAPSDDDDSKSSHEVTVSFNNLPLGSRVATALAMHPCVVADAGQDVGDLAHQFGSAALRCGSIRERLSDVFSDGRHIVGPHRTGMKIAAERDAAALHIHDDGRPDRWHPLHVHRSRTPLPLLRIVRFADRSDAIVERGIRAFFEPFGLRPATRVERVGFLNPYRMRLGSRAAPGGDSAKRHPVDAGESRCGCPFLFRL